MLRTRCKYVGLACLTTLALIFLNALLYLNIDEKGRCLSHIAEYDVAWVFMILSASSQLICVLYALILALSYVGAQQDENVTNNASSDGAQHAGGMFDDAHYVQDAGRHNKRVEAYLVSSGMLLSVIAGAALTIFATVQDKQRCLATPFTYWHCFWFAPGSLCCLYLLILFFDCCAASLSDFSSYLLALASGDVADPDPNEDVQPSDSSSPLYDPPVLHQAEL